MEIITPSANILSIGQDKYLFMNAGKAEYKWFCDNIAKKFGPSCMTRAKLYFFIEDRTDISYLKKFFNLSSRNIKMTKGKYRGIKINIYAPTAIKTDIRELLYQYEGLYHLDGTDWIYFSISDKQYPYDHVYHVRVGYSFDTGFSITIRDYVKDNITKIRTTGVVSR